MDYKPFTKWDAHPSSDLLRGPLFVIAKLGNITPTTIVYGTYS